ncbi:MAG TPA: hydroxyacylglutathione hydrolase [Polyangiaceae bacterium]|nr:hydroxyacylglutathione hydrolase [Polyangiaceae bacterium]
MAHVVTQPQPAFRSQSGALEVHQIPAASDNLVWLLVCLKTRTCAVVDGPDAENALAYAKAHGLDISVVINTHTHGDHVGVNLDLEARGLLDDMRVIGPAAASADVPGITEQVRHGDRVQLGALTGQVLETSGHLAGHVSYVFEDVVFCGDALFTGGCGRVFTGDFVAMHTGLARLAGLDAATRVCCAHEYTEDNLRFALSVEPENQALVDRAERVRLLRAKGGCAVPSLIGEELSTNPMLRWTSPDLIAHVREQSKNPALSTPVEVFTATRKLKDSGAYRASR